MSEKIKILIVVDLYRWNKDDDVTDSVSNIFRQKIPSLVKEIKTKCDLRADIEVEKPGDYGIFWEMTMEDTEEI